MPQLWVQLFHPSSTVVQQQDGHQTRLVPLPQVFDVVPSVGCTAGMDMREIVSYFFQGRKSMSSMWYGTIPIPANMISPVVSRPMVKLVIAVLVVEPIFGIMSLEFVNEPLLGHMPNYWLNIPHKIFRVIPAPKKSKRSEALCVQFPPFPLFQSPPSPKKSTHIQWTSFLSLQIFQAHEEENKEEIVSRCQTKSRQMTDSETSPIVMYRAGSPPNVTFSKLRNLHALQSWWVF